MQGKPASSICVCLIILIIFSLVAPINLLVNASEVTTREQVIPSKHNVGQWTSMALDSSDFPHVSYTDPDNGDLKYAEWGSGTGGFSGWLVKETVVEGAFSVG